MVNTIGPKNGLFVLDLLNQDRCCALCYLMASSCVFIVLGSKILGLNVLELQFVMLENHYQNVLVFVLDLLKVCLYVKLESSVLQDLLCKSA